MSSNDRYFIREQVERFQKRFMIPQIEIRCWDRDYDVDLSRCIEELALTETNMHREKVKMSLAWDYKEKRYLCVKISTDTNTKTTFQQNIRGTTDDPSRDPTRNPF